MIILTNAFPTNLPDSIKVSQGGPAGFARLFINYLNDTKTEYHWIGVMLQGTYSDKVQLRKVFGLPEREYFRLFTPKEDFNRITQANKKVDPAIVLKTSIDRLADFMKERKPDIVLLNGFGLLNWLLMKAAEKVNIPVVVQHAGIWTRELRIHKGIYSEIGRQLLENMEKDSSKLTSAEIFLNEWSRDYYRENVAKRNDNQTYIVPLPFDFESFEKLKFSNENSVFDFSKDTINIGFIARWDKIKNHELVLEIAKLISSRNLPWKIYAVTSIPDKPETTKERDEYKKYINVIPGLDRAGISAFCKSVDLLIQPSVFDVSPTVVLEAVATNTPIAISPTVGYVSDFAIKNAKQWVLDAKSPQKIVDNIKLLIDKGMPSVLRNHLQTAHDHRRVFAAYLDLFQKMIVLNKVNNDKF